MHHLRQVLASLMLLTVACRPRATPRATLPQPGSDQVAEVHVYGPTASPGSGYALALRLTLLSPTLPACQSALQLPPAVPVVATNPTTVTFDSPYDPLKTCTAGLPTVIPVGTGYTAYVRLSADSCDDATVCESTLVAAVPRFDIVTLNPIGPPAALPGAAVRP